MRGTTPSFDSFSSPFFFPYRESRKKNLWTEEEENVTETPSSEEPKDPNRNRGGNPADIP